MREKEATAFGMLSQTILLIQCVPEILVPHGLIQVACFFISGQSQVQLVQTFLAYFSPSSKPSSRMVSANSSSSNSVSNISFTSAFLFKGYLKQG